MDALTEVLAEGFVTDPFVGWLVGGDAARVRRYVRLVLERLTLPHQSVWMSADRRSVACWAPPGAWELGLGEQLRLLPGLLRSIGWSRLMPAARASARIEQGRPERYWYLALVATATEARGRGLARAVLRPALDEAEGDAPALLETSNEGNLAFYRKLGFEVVRELPPADGAPAVWTMQRG
ncbi:MAG: GNAT family N-acetyltransferase [Deltaproteobacteria bacterium]|nr:GNAT family N-acetyltransferase [Deltaproteobacteria bacterium]